MADKLTVKQEKYAQLLFVKELSQTDAYKSVYNCDNMSDKTIHENASRLANNSKVAARIAELTNEFKERNMVTIERVLAEYAKLGFFDPRKLFNADGSPKEITDLDDDTAAVLAGLEVNEIYEGVGENRQFVGYTKKYKLADKKGALDSMAKHLGMFVEKHELFGKDGGAIQVIAAVPRPGRDPT